MEQIEAMQKQQELKNAKERSNLESLISVLNKTTLKFSLKAGEEGKLFGSVTTQMISDELAEQGLKVDKKEITLEDSIKELGTHKVNINFGEDLSATIKVKVDEESE